MSLELDMALTRIDLDKENADRKERARYQERLLSMIKAQIPHRYEDWKKEILSGTIQDPRLKVWIGNERYKSGRGTLWSNYVQSIIDTFPDTIK